MFSGIENRRDLGVALTGRLVSTFGDGVALIALVLRLQEGGAHPYTIALLMGAGGLPILMLARPVGRLADAYDSRRLLVAAGVVELGCTVPLIVEHSVWVLLALAFVLGAASSVSSATWSALMPHIAGEDQVAAAVSAQQSVSVLAMVGAPAVGGLLAGAFGTGLPLAFDAATYLVLIIATLAVRTRRTPNAAVGAEASSAVGDGFAILRADRVLAPLLAGLAVVVLLVGMVDIMLVFLVRDTLHAGGVWYGVVEASWMLGMVGGCVGSGRVATERGRVRLAIGGVAVTCGMLAGFAIAPTVAVLLPLSIVGGIGNGYAVTCASTLITVRTPDSARGRVSAAASSILGGAQGASLLLGGVVASYLSPRGLYALAGLLGLATAGVLAVVQLDGRRLTVSRFRSIFT